MIDKDAIPLVGKDSMNDMHHEEVEIINTLWEYIEKEDTKAIAKQLEVLLEHMQEHFSSEEELMKGKAYPMYSIHQSDHSKVLNEVRHVYMNWRNTKDINQVKDYLKNELTVWLDQHIKAMDMPLSDFLQLHQNSQAEEEKDYFFTW